MIALTLLRGPLNPDPQSDQEEHHFIYALYPHGHGWREAQTIQQALDLNNPALALLADSHDGPLPPTHSFLTVDSDHLTLEAVKRAETSDHLLLRLVERHGAEEDITVHFAAPLQSAEECNLLEREQIPAEFYGNELTFRIKPYEIRTFLVKESGK